MCIRDRARPLFPIGFDGIISSAGGYIEVHGQKIFESCLSQEDIQLARHIFDQHHILYNLEANPVSYTHLDVYKRQMVGLFKKEIPIR